MEARIQLVAIVAAGLLFAGVFELVRRRRLLERYAVVWLGSTIALIAIAAWSGLLRVIATAIGIHYAPSALFVIAFGFTLLLLLHFSIAVSRLADQAKVLAQRMALLEERNRELEGAVTRRGDEDHAARPRTFARPVSGARR